MTTTVERLQQFILFCQERITGDKKGEAQIFLDRFFQAFGHKGALAAGAVYEMRIRKDRKKGQTGLADLVWKPRVLIEMKPHGVDLSKHFSQAFDNWQRAIPNRPHYVLLCNFNQFWIYDFATQIDTPIDRIHLEELPQRTSALAFMELEERQPVFQNNQVENTEKAAHRMGQLLVGLKQRGIDALTAQRFILQCVLAMFAEDRGLLPDRLFVQCLQDCLGGERSYDVLTGLFQAMNSPGITPAGRFKGVDYFNGGLFKTIHPVDLSREELKFLEESALEDWSQVRPAIFGNILESAIDAEERHARGIHYTSEADIMKIVRSTISRYWEDRIEQASSSKQLNRLQLELQNYRVLDPACGSGNFLYIAYQELKQIEQDLRDKMAARRRSPQAQIQMGFVTPLQFFGIDNNPFAVELARVTLTIARKAAIDRLGLLEPALPPDTLDRNIVCEDALFTQWPQADAIIGNPPFLGGKGIRTELGDPYAEALYQKFSDVRDSVDFCSYWFRIAHQSLSNSGRAGLVGTNSISQGRSRAAALDYIVQNQGFIHEAISSQVWSGDAKVHVSLVNWSKQEATPIFLDNASVNFISASLKSDPDVSDSKRLAINQHSSFQGIIPVGKGFYVSEATAIGWIEADTNNQDVLKKSSSAFELTECPHGLPSRWIVDFNNMTLAEASHYKLPFEHIRSTVKPIRDRNRRATTRVTNKRPHGDAATLCAFLIDNFSKKKTS